MMRRLEEYRFIKGVNDGIVVRGGTVVMKSQGTEQMISFADHLRECGCMDSFVVHPYFVLDQFKYEEVELSVRKLKRDRHTKITIYKAVETPDYYISDENFDKWWAVLRRGIRRAKSHLDFSLIQGQMPGAIIKVKSDELTYDFDHKEKNKEDAKLEERKIVISNAGWEDMIRMMANETDPDIDFYRDCLITGGFTLDIAKKIALESSIRLRRTENDGVAIWFKKGDRTVCIVVTDEEKVYWAVRDYLEC